MIVTNETYCAYGLCSDIIVIGDDLKETKNLKTLLAKAFEIKDLGTLRYFMGMEMARWRQDIFVSQQKYVLDLLQKTKWLVWVWVYLES